MRVFAAAATDEASSAPLWVLIVGVAMLVVALPIVGRRVLFLFRLITSGQPAPDRVEGVTHRLGKALRNQVVEVFAQRRLLKWTIPGAAHAMVFWAFVILGSVYLEAFGILFSRNPQWAIPLIGHWDLLGFAQDTIALLCLLGLVTFWWIRIKNNPERLGRKSRFDGSHLGGAYLVLFMIFNVIWTMFLFRGAAAAAGNLPYGWGAYASHTVGLALEPLGHGAVEGLENVGLLLHIGVMLVFLVDVVHSKHLHIFLAPINVLFKREEDGVALGAVKPLTSDGKPVTLEDIEEMDEETTLGVGSIEDFSWKGLLDMATCTECGRCQSQCPAWNTEKPLSPKLLMMNLRDHAFAKGDYLLTGEEGRAGLSTAVLEEAERPLVGETEGDAWHPTGGGVIDPDVLWSCVTCGACVQQCPVDIEHVDHIVDMRRYQVLVESNFPAELAQLFKGMENKGNPWNMSATARMDWAKGLDFEVPVVGEDLESLESVDWLFWVGCAGAYEDRAMKTTRAVAELLNIAGVSFGVLGNGETCTGDSARRAGNEFLFQGLAQQNIETFKEFKVKKVVSTCAHCFNTLKNEYKDFGIELEVVHHTQLLNRLVREGKLTPVAEGAGAAKRSITYHDPCYIGRHNKVYEPPRELLQILPGAEYVEMERAQERSFCCGAGGARMWMEETIGERINVNRTKEAVATGADQIAVGCPFCRVMLSDGLTAEQADGNARAEVEVLDVAQMLLASVKGVPATRVRKDDEPSAPAAKATPAAAGAPEAKAAPAEAAPAAAPASGGSLFDLGEAPAAPAKPASSDLGAGGSLFDLGGEAPAEPEAKAAPAKPATGDLGAGGSLFDLGTPAAEPDAEPTPAPAAKAEPAPAAPPAPVADLGSGGSLFDIAPAEPAAAAAEPKATEPVAEVPRAETPKAEVPAAPAAEPATGIDLSAGGSLFDIAAPEPAATPAEAPASAPEPTEPAPTEPAPTEPGPAAESQPEAPKAEATPASASTGPASAPATDVDISSVGSLFDIAAPEPVAAPAAETVAAAAEAPAPVPAEAPTGDAPGDQPGDPDTVLDADDAPAETEADEPGPVEPDAAEPEPEIEDDEAKPEEPPAKPAPTVSGEAHQPRTDADITGASSLFDL